MKAALSIVLCAHLFCANVAFSQSEPQWTESVSAAYKTAVAQKRFLFVEFVPEGSEAVTRKMQLPNSGQHVFTTCKVTEKDDKSWRAASVFSVLSTRAGVVILDYTGEKGDPTYGRVVSVMPSHKVNQTNVQALLDLPKGTLTQRSMVWAIRVHPQNPQSTEGSTRTDLLSHAQMWANKMATESSTTRRPYWSGSMLQTPAQEHCMTHPGSSEVLSTTWMGRSSEVTDAATELVGTWHDAYHGRNEGHWGFVLQRWGSYGYDMGYDAVNRMWYACGVAQ